MEFICIIFHLVLLSQRWSRLQQGLDFASCFAFVHCSSDFNNGQFWTLLTKLNTNV